MNTPFFITGMPRSRTSWLANLFTTGEQICEHDVLGHLPVADFIELVKRGGFEGYSDTGLVPLFPRISGLFPVARWLLVLREPGDCLKSLLKATEDTEWQEAARAAVENFDLAAYERGISQMIRDSRVMVIRFESLDDYEAVMVAWRWLCPHLNLSRERFDLLTTLQVQPMFRKLQMPKELVA